MSLRRLLPTLDNAGRRLVLAEVLGQPVSVKLRRRAAALCAPHSALHDERAPQRTPSDVSSPSANEREDPDV